MRDIADEILETAGADHAARRPAGEVIEFPLVSPWLRRERREPMPEGQPLTETLKPHLPMPLWLRAVKYTLLLAMFSAGAWLYADQRRLSILAEVGEMTCSDSSSLMWLKDDPGSSVPELNEAVLLRCAKAYQIF